MLLSSIEDHHNGPKCNLVSTNSDKYTMKVFSTGTIEFPAPAASTGGKKQKKKWSKARVRFNTRDRSTLSQFRVWSRKPSNSAMLNMMNTKAKPR